MILEVGDIITLDANNRDYIVLKNIIYNNINYYYLMTTDKPVEVNIVKIVQGENSIPLITTVTNETELTTIMNLTKE